MTEVESVSVTLTWTVTRESQSDRRLAANLSLLEERLAKK